MVKIVDSSVSIERLADWAINVPCNMIYGPKDFHFCSSINFILMKIIWLTK